MDLALDLVAIGRVSVDLYGQQVGSRLEDIASFAKAVGGSPANVAIGAARLGLRSALVTRVGDEPMGRFVREQLAREGVDGRGVRTDPQRLTSLVLLSVRDAETFPLIFYRENCADSALGEDDIDEELIGAARAVLVTGTHFSLERGRRAQHKAIDLARRHGRRVLLDIDYRPNLWGIGGHDAGESRYARSSRVTAALATVLPRCDLIVGTEEEMHVAAGHEDSLEAVRRVRAMSNAVIVLKRGARGCVVFAGPIPERLEDALVVPGFDIEVYNVLGAGDAFLAGFLLGYLRDEPHELSARFANACGAIAVSRLMCSTEFATLAELTHYLGRGSAKRALRDDPELTHLHWATSRNAAPSTLFILDAARAATALPDRLIVEAAARVAASRSGIGVRVEGTLDLATLRIAQRQKLLLARRVSPDSLSPVEWPAGMTVVARYSSQEERYLPGLASSCRAQGRELVLEVGTGDPAPTVMARLYELGLRPDWWAIESLEAEELAECERLIGAHDGYCRGMLVVLGSQLPAATALAAASPAVRGFIAGGGILTERIMDESLVRDLAQHFEAQIAAWLAARKA